MELRNLTYFVVLAEELHFGRAAKKLNISQPPLSQQLQKFENELGAKLFERNHKGVTLTNVGRVLLPEARRVLEQVDIARDVVSKALRGNTGEIRVGYGETASFRLLSTVMQEFRNRFPLVEIILTEMPTDLQINALREGKIDIGLIHPPKTTTDLQLQYILSDPLVIILPENHPLAGLQEISLSALRDEIFVVPLRESGPLAEYIGEICNREGFSPKVAQHDVQRLTVSTLVAGGAGIALLPDSSKQVFSPGVVYADLIPNTLGLELHAAYKKDATNAIIRNFLDVIARTQTSEKRPNPLK